MDLSTWTLFTLIALLGLNHLVIRIEALARRPAVFWAVNLIDVVAGVGVLFFGLPGFEHAPPVRIVVGLLFLIHMAQNIKLRADREAAARRAQRAAEREAWRRQREAEESGDEDPGPEGP